MDPGSKYIGVATRINGAYNTYEVNTPEAIWWTIVNGQWDHVIIEDFVAVEISHYGTATLKIIGGVLGLCWHKEIPCTVQTAGQRITYIPRADELMLKLYGTKRPRDHEQSAMAHMLKWEHDNP